MPRLLKVAEQWTADADVASDLVQRVCISILMARPGWCRRSVMSWAIYKLRSEADHWRQGEHRRSRRRKRAGADLVRPSRTPAERLEHKIKWDRLMAALRTLPARRRKVWELRHLEGMTVQQIAEALGIAAKTVENTLRAARTHLLASLGVEPAGRR